MGKAIVLRPGSKFTGIQRMSSHTIRSTEKMLQLSKRTADPQYIPIERISWPVVSMEAHVYNEKTE